jgi:hypothetical protein
MAAVKAVEPKTVVAPTPEAMEAALMQPIKEVAAPRRAARKAPAKKAAVKKAEAKEPKAERRAPVSNDAVIHVVDLNKCDLHGKRSAAVRTMRDNMTVEAFKAALERKDLKGYGGWALRTALAAKAITVKA